eukprot:SAG11_NODE_1653_length_4508_cov_6.277387_1_plen_30_part_00
MQKYAYMNMVKYRTTPALEEDPKDANELM